MAENDLDKAKEEFQAAVSDMAAKIREQSAAFMTSAPRTEVPRPQVDLSPEGLTNLAKEKGVGEALKAVGQHILAPMNDKSYELSIKTQRRVIERDAELGKWAKKHSKALDEAIRRDPVRAAEEGLDSIVRGLRDGDAEYQTERTEAEVQRRLTEERAKAAAAPAPFTTPAPRTPIDRPAPVAGAPSAAAAPTSAEAAIAAIPVDPEELEFFQRLVPGATAADLQRQRYEREKLQRELGPLQIRHLGGIPICSLEELGQEPKP